MIENIFGIENPWLSKTTVSGEDYDAPYVEKAAAGQNVHGEADFVQALRPKSVLDAGCGTGRVAIELARRGIEVVGVDLDMRMLGTAKNKAPHLEWVQADLESVDLGRKFDVIVMAGNVMVYVTPGTEGAIIRNLARHLNPGGHLVAGFQLAIGCIELEEYDTLAKEVGLLLDARYSTWDHKPWHAANSYAVSVHTLEA